MRWPCAVDGAISLQLIIIIIIIIIIITLSVLTKTDLTKQKRSVWLEICSTLKLTNSRKQAGCHNDDPIPVPVPSTSFSSKPLQRKTATCVELWRDFGLWWEELCSALNITQTVDCALQTDDLPTTYFLIVHWVHQCTNTSTVITSSYGPKTARWLLAFKEINQDIQEVKKNAIYSGLYYAHFRHY